MPIKVETWLKRQLGDGKEQVAENVVIQGMMAGFSEQRTRRAAQALQITRSYAQEKAYRTAHSWNGGRFQPENEHKARFSLVGGFFWYNGCSF